MDSTLAYVVIVIAILTAVVFFRWLEQQNNFEQNSHNQEQMNLFREGFEAGINASGGMLDSTLRRLGYTYPEQIKQQTEEPTVEEKSDTIFVPPHELDSYLDEAAEKDNAEWMQQVVLPQDES